MKKSAGDGQRLMPRRKRIPAHVSFIAARRVQAVLLGGHMDFAARNQHALRTKAELPVMIGGAESILPAGSNIVLNATDGETYAKFTIQETGQEGILNVQRTAGDYYNVTIAGQNEYDCFENLPYAG